MSRSLYYLATGNEYKAIQDTLIMITGSCPIQKINKDYIQNLNPHHESVLFTPGILPDSDLKQIKTNSNICLISGFNLFMLLDAILGIETNIPFAQYIEKIVNNGKQSIDYFIERC